jgi:quercetin dioxygenase-like cupin family protein
MAKYAVKRIDEMEAVFGGAFKRARAELGVESFGMQVLDMPAETGDRYPEHDHGEDGQEEVYAVLRGTGEIEIEGERHALDPEVIVRVGPGVKRKLFAGPEGIRILALGGVPGQPYEPPDVTKLGSPDPLAQQS